MMKWIGAVLGAIAVLLGGLWFLQGTGLVTIGPILCIAECEALEGPSLLWAVLGLGLLMVGAAGIWFALLRRR